MRKYSNRVVVTAGPVDAATVTVKIAGTATNASLFSDEAGLVPLANPVTTDTFGYFAFYVADGTYDLVILKTAVISVTWGAVSIVDPRRVFELTLNSEIWFGLINAYYDRAAAQWKRLDTAKTAHGFQVTTNGYLSLRRAPAGANPITWLPTVTPDFEFSLSTGGLKAFFRSVILEEAGDSPEVGFQRHQGTYPDGARAAVGSGTIGIIYALPYDGTSFQAIGDIGRPVEVRLLTAEVPTQTNRAGEFEVRTTPSGGVTPLSAFKVKKTQQVGAVIAGTVAAPALIVGDDVQCGIYRPGALSIGFAYGGVEGVRFDDPVSGDTAMLIRRNVGGTPSFTRVSMGPTDSGGVGFKYLRVPN